MNPSQSRRIAWRFLLLVLTALLVVTPTPAAAQDGEGQNPHITVEITRIDYLRDMHSSDDWTDAAEGRLWIVTAQTCKGQKATLVLPTDDVESIYPRQYTDIFAGTSLGVCIDGSTDRVFYHLIFFDEDQLGTATIGALSQGITWISEKLKTRAGALRGMAKGSLAYLALKGTSIILQNPFVQEEIISYFSSSDVMGEVTLDLSRDDGWQADGKPHTVESTNGAVTFTYVVRVADSLGNPQTTSSITLEQRRTSANLNLRTGPGMQFKKIRTLKARTLVNLTGNEDKGWYEVRVGEDQGWVHGDYIRNP
jgi:Bacterial SH3 domain